MITERDMAELHDQAVSVLGTAEEVTAWFRAQDIDPDGVYSFGKVLGTVGAQSVTQKRLETADAIGAAAIAGVELGIRIERLRRERA